MVSGASLVCRPICFHTVPDLLFPVSELCAYTPFCCVFLLLCARFASRTLISQAGRPLPSSVTTLSGVVNLESQARLESALFRATRGNVFTHFQEVSPAQHRPLLRSAGPQEQVFITCHMPVTAQHQCQSIKTMVSL